MSDLLPAEIASWPLERRIRFAISDPGAFFPRGDDYTEPITHWGARAVMAVVQPMLDAKTATVHAQLVEQQVAQRIPEVMAQLDEQAAELVRLKATLAEVLAVFFTVMSDQTGEVLGYLAPAASIHPDDFTRWQAVLDQPQEPEGSCGVGSQDGVPR